MRLADNWTYTWRINRQAVSACALLPRRRHYHHAWPPRYTRAAPGATSRLPAGRLASVVARMQPSRCSPSPYAANLALNTILSLREERDKINQCRGRGGAPASHGVQRNRRPRGHQGRTAPRPKPRPGVDGISNTVHPFDLSAIGWITCGPVHGQWIAKSAVD